MCQWDTRQRLHTRHGVQYREQAQINCNGCFTIGNKWEESLPQVVGNFHLDNGERLLVQGKKHIPCKEGRILNGGRKYLGLQGPFTMSEASLSDIFELSI